MKPRFLLKIDLNGILNCNTFSAVTSRINENVKNVLFHWNAALKKYFNNKYLSNKCVLVNLICSFRDFSSGKAGATKLGLVLLPGTDVGSSRLKSNSWKWNKTKMKWTRPIDIESLQNRLLQVCYILRCLWCYGNYIDIKSLQNRLLKVCYVPATSASLNRLIFFTAAINSTNEANKAGSMRR